MLKKVLISLLLSTLYLCANELNFSNKLIFSQEEAVTKNKKILVMFTQENCPTCEYMESVAFEDALLANYMNKQFILVKLDINKDTMPQDLNVYGTPTFYILNAQGQKQGRPIVGGGTPQAFLTLLKSYQKQ
ncbi:MAG: thioredoxin family protein [Arcobacteraceae bacterium]